jgi:alkanesulfonate monooxygenase SsuD/methylene tetrahydromethanopterin reductase-like flavin-dependent oxidoreductase (luciferase family)
MRTLKSLNPFGRLLVTEDFRRGDPAAVDADQYIEEVNLGREVPLGPLREVVAEAMRRFEHDPQKSDPWLGPRVHATLRLTRREAADKSIWEYLTVVEFPHYVRWRWEKVDNPDKVVPQDRFLGEDSKNALARLWWTTELTRNGSNYERCVVALGISRFSVSWLRLILAHHRAAALAVVDFLDTYQGKGATDTQGQVMAKAANVALRTLCLDALAASPPTDAEAVREWISQKVDETTMMDELPLGPDEAEVSEIDIAAVREFLDDLAQRIQLAGVVKTDGRLAAVSG